MAVEEALLLFGVEVASDKVLPPLPLGVHTAGILKRYNLPLHSICSERGTPTPTPRYSTPSRDINEELMTSSHVLSV